MMTAAKLRLYARLQSAAHLVKKKADRTLLEAAGVTTAQAAVLAVVANGAGDGEDAKAGGPTQRDVAAALGLNESALTAMTNRLIALDYLYREKDPEDRRAWRLALTPQGKKAMKRIKAPFEAINAGLEQAIGADGLADFAENLSAISEGFSGEQP